MNAIHNKKNIEKVELTYLIMFIIDNAILRVKRYLKRNYRIHFRFICTQIIIIYKSNNILRLVSMHGPNRMKGN